MEYWNDFIHQLHHEEERGRTLHKEPTQISTWIDKLDPLETKMKTRDKKERKGKPNKIIGESNHTRKKFKIWKKL